MDVGQISQSTTAMALAVRQLQAINEAQLATMKNIAEGQQQIAEVLQPEGIGQNINVMA